MLYYVCTLLDFFGPTHFVSINTILLTQGPIHQIFTNFFLRIGDFEKCSFFESAILDYFFQKKEYFASSPWKSVKATWVSRMGQNFDDCPGLQQKSKCAKIICYTVYLFRVLCDILQKRLIQHVIFLEIYYNYFFSQEIMIGSFK